MDITLKIETSRGWIQTLARCVAAVLFIGIGLDHLIRPQFFRDIVPPGFGPPALMVAISGVCEIAGGVGLLIPILRRAAGLGLIALLVAVFPANIYMVIDPHAIPDFHVAQWVLWARLPLQPVFIACVWYAALRRPAQRNSISKNV